MLPRVYCILVSGFMWIGNTDFPVYSVDTGYCELREANLSWDWESSSWSDKNRCWCENGSITMVINWLGPTWSQLGAWIFYFSGSVNIASAHSNVWLIGLRSPGCVREGSPVRHLNKEGAEGAPSAEPRLAMLFSWGENKTLPSTSQAGRPLSVLQANSKVSVLQLYGWKHDVSIKTPHLSSSHRSKQ